MKSVIVMLDQAGPSFCYYPSPTHPVSRAMDQETLARAVAFAAARGSALQVVAGREGVSAAQRALLVEHEHVCYVPLTAGELHAADVPVVNVAEREHVARLEPGRHLIALLRVDRDELSAWPDVWLELSRRAQRVVVVLLHQDQYTSADLTRYATSLAAVSDALEQAYLADETIELNVLSDRLVLDGPAECGAGIEHVTIDPSGTLHLCPGFALAGAPAIGQLPDAPQIPNQQLLRRDRAPICALCDAYHCRRCVFVNHRATLEHNTPPWQTCRAAHLEREATRRLLERLHAKQRMIGVPPIAPIPYGDPFEMLTGRTMCDGQLTAVGRPVAAAPPQRPAPEPRQGAEHPPWSGAVCRETAMEDNKPVGRVTPAERDEIRELFLRKSALTELFLSLAKLDAETLEKSPLYEKVLKDMGLATVQFQSWWDRKAAQYGWTKKAGGRWNIDFETCEITLV